MFEVDTNLWLQQFGAPWVLWLMELLSAMGRSEVYMPLFLCLAFGVALRPALALLLAMLVADAATNAAKLGFALPRPSEVDVRVINKGEPGHALVEHGAATEFFGLPSDASIAAVRAAGKMDYGFISGHASAAAAFAIGIVLMFGVRRRWAWMIAIGWALMMGVSRLYLGRHFLADVLGGWVVGAMAAWLFACAIHHHSPQMRRRACGVTWMAVAITWLSSFKLAFVQPAALGGIVGGLICLWVVNAFPHDDRASIGQRSLRVLCALLVGYGMDIALKAIWPSDGRHPLEFLLAALGYVVALLGTWWMARQLRLYPRAGIA